ncbi:MAG: NUDIX domain-containing protein [Flavobacteriales bacterium]|nr:NUDIX domain-containing protein [Flavobacteriales bacterium]
MSLINLSVDCVILGFDDDQKLKILLIKKKINKTGDLQYAIPGDLLKEDEDLLSGAKRILKSLTSLDNLFLKQFRVFGNPLRTKDKKDQAWLNMYRKNPEERVVTVGYLSLVKMENYLPQASSFALDAEWVDLKSVPNNLAFDHNEIIESGLINLRTQLDHKIISNLLPSKFTLSQLQYIYEILLDEKLDKRNFRKTISKISMIKKTKEKQEGVAHKPAFLYTYEKL